MFRAAYLSLLSDESWSGRCRWIKPLSDICRWCIMWTPTAAAISTSQIGASHNSEVGIDGYEWDNRMKAHRLRHTAMLTLTFRYGETPCHSCFIHTPRYQTCGNRWWTAKLKRCIQNQMMTVKVSWDLLLPLFAECRVSWSFLSSGIRWKIRLHYWSCAKLNILLRGDSASSLIWSDHFACFASNVPMNECWLLEILPGNIIWPSCCKESLWKVTLKPFEDGDPNHYWY